VAPVAGQPSRRLLLDAGAVFAVLRGDRQVHANMVEAVRLGYWIVMPTPVLAQVHRGGRDRAVMDRFLRNVAFVPTSEAIARRAGELQARTETSDAIDAIVAAEALASSAALILTSDPADLARLIEGEPEARRVAVLGV
jgi:predicted nucleic acid-binding protein